MIVDQFSDWYCNGLTTNTKVTYGKEREMDYKNKSCNDVNNVDLVFHLLQIDTCEMVSELNRMRLRA